MYSLLYLSTTRKSILILWWCKAPVFVCKRLFLQHFAMWLVDIILFKRRWHKTPSWTSREQFVCGVLSEQSGLWHSAPVSVVACGQRILTSSFCCQICVTYVTYIYDIYMTYTVHIHDIYMTYMWHICDNVQYTRSPFIIFYHFVLSVSQTLPGVLWWWQLVEAQRSTPWTPIGQVSKTMSRRCHDDVGCGRHGEGTEKTLFQSL